MLQNGTVLNGTYKIENTIGSGGGGIVYKAYHERLKTYVVVKQIKEQVKGILDGRAEADILKNIKHSRLPRVYDFLEIDGEIYTVMDYIPGKSLAEALKDEGKFSSKEVYQWALQLADALKYLHEQTPSIIHSDIKPANIMLMPDRSVVLIDFNVSLMFDEGVRISAGISEGYSPPEQYRDYESYSKGFRTLDDETVIEEDATVLENQRRRITDRILEVNVSEETRHLIGKGIDERSDIFSLGATIYHLLTGMKFSKMFEEMDSIEEYDIQIGEGFKIILNKMLEVSPEKRYQNGGELLYALEHVIELDSEYQLYRKKIFRKKIATLGLYAVGIVLVGAGIFTMKKETITAYNREVLYAEELIKNKRFEEAEESIIHAQELMPEKIEAYEKELLRIYSLEMYEETIRYGIYIINNPAYTITNKNDEKIFGDMLYIVGNAYFEQEDYANASECFLKAIEMNQRNASYYRDYSVTQIKKGNIVEAKQALEKAVDLGLGEDSVYMVQGEIAFAAGENEAAIEYLLKAIRTTQNDEVLRRGVLLCAKGYEQLGDDYIEQEISLLVEAEQRLGMNSLLSISEKLAETYARKAKQSDESSLWYEKALEKFQGLYENGYITRQMMENIAVIYEQMDLIEEAEQMLNQIIEKYPEDYRAYKRMAFLEADKQQRKANEKRSYWKMKEYYEDAVLLYEASGIEGDTEMDMLENMMKDLKSGGWF